MAGSPERQGSHGAHAPSSTCTLLIYANACLHIFRTKSPRLEEPARGTQISPEVLQVINHLVSANQTPQQPLSNTLSLQMLQNRQMTEALINLPKMMFNAKNSASHSEQSQGLKELPDNPAHGLYDHGAAHHGQANVENITDDEMDFDIASNVGSEEDFEEFSSFPEMSQPLTLVEKLEKLYDRLPRLQRLPPVSAQAAASVREIPEIAGRVRSLPAPPIILAAFQKFRTSYRKQEGTSLVVDDHTGEKVAMVDEADYSKKKTALNSATKKSDFQFQVHEPSYPELSKLDTDYTKLFKSGCGDMFRISRKQLNHIQSIHVVQYCTHY